ncbi:MAG TPA: hypothetical protein VN428_13695 [Bryobacteraceae bacterium]|nr:hypothetical protein [Bryobacteraceae bacterium]
MSKKWYSLFVSLEPSQPETAETASVRSAAQTVADLAASLAPPQPVESVPPALAQTAVTGSFSEIYDAAGIQPPAHGYGILKVAEMLQSEHIRSLPREVKRSSILLALESSGASLQEVIQDAVQRDRALDTFERVQEQALGALDTAKSKENKDIQAELDRITAEYRARMQANTDEVARERERFYGWRLKKQEEEQKIAEAVSYFVTENPITTRPAPPVGKPARGAAAAPSASSPDPATKAGE